MPLTQELFRAAAQAFDPYRPGSGTEHLALVLYSLMRMTRPARVIEFGSGYTTLFMLAALADNAADVAEEEAQLRVKTAAVGDRSVIGQGIEHPAVKEWFGGGHKACAVDPRYYLRTYTPQLYAFEQRDGDHEYVARMTQVVSELGYDTLFTYLQGRRFDVEALPPEALPIDLAWHDDTCCELFYEQFWPVLNPEGGLMIYHNTASVESSWDLIRRLAEKHAKAGDMEILTLQEPHKLNQNSCTILRRTTTYQPSYLTRTLDHVAAGLEQWLARHPGQAPTT